jgi:hypothetical protein
VQHNGVPTERHLAAAMDLGMPRTYVDDRH